MTSKCIDVCNTDNSTLTHFSFIYIQAASNAFLQNLTSTEISIAGSQEVTQILGAVASVLNDQVIIWMHSRTKHCCFVNFRKEVEYFKINKRDFESLDLLLHNQKENFNLQKKPSRKLREKLLILFIHIESWDPSGKCARRVECQHPFQNITNQRDQPIHCNIVQVLFFQVNSLKLGAGEVEARTSISYHHVADRTNLLRFGLVIVLLPSP